MTTDESKTEVTTDRTAEYILDHGIPLSECNESELNAVIEYRAQVKARSAVFQKQMEEMQAANRKIIESSAASAQKFADQLAQIKDQALANYEKSVSDDV